MYDRRLDRLVNFDSRSRNFSVRAILGATPRKPRSYSWQCNLWLDQGREGACVGFAWAHDLAARPATVAGMTGDVARTIYRRAQELDPWEGSDYEGTSVLAGVKAVMELHPGKYGSYRWCFGLRDVLDTLGYLGPVVLGIPWFSGMYNTDRDGFIRATGDMVGGHAILARGVSHRKKAVILHNSWGQDWGVNGDALISFDDLEAVLYEEGEACAPMQRRR